MNKKNEKRLCWNCEGNVSHHIAQCPYCGVDLTQPTVQGGSSTFKNLASPFQTAPQKENSPYAKKSGTLKGGHFKNGSAEFAPPYENKSTFQELALPKQEWDSAQEEEKESTQQEEDLSPTTKREMIALLLLLPGVVFFLFGLALIFFSTDGILTLSWNQNVAYFYFLGAAPLLFLGWRAFRR